MFFSFFLKRKSARFVSSYAVATDEELYRRFAGGDERAFEVLLDRHGGKVLGYFHRFFGDRELAEDLTQEVFLRVASSAGRFRGDSSFTTFVFRIVRNLCIDHMRYRSSRPETGARSLEEPGLNGEGSPLGDRIPARDPTGVGHARTESREMSGALEKGLAALPPEQREVFLLREVEGMKFGEIAALTGVTESTVKSRMRYALKALRGSLEAFGKVT